MSQEEFALEFAKVKGGIEAATDVLTGVLMRDAKGPWEYLVVAVPVDRGDGRTQIGLMSSVDADMLPSFFRYLAEQYERCNKAGGVLIEKKAQGSVQ